MNYMHKHLIALILHTACNYLRFTLACDILYNLEVSGLVSFPNITTIHVITHTYMDTNVYFILPLLKVFYFPLVVVRDLQLMVVLSVFLHLPKEDENLLLVDPGQTALEEVDQRDAGTALSHRQ